MSFMSFDYAMRAADAALQFHSQQGQNVKDTGQKVRDVGTGNAKRKDEQVRNKIEAEYAAKSADVKKQKMEQLMAFAEKQKNSAQLAQMLAGGLSLAGGFGNGIMDLLANDGTQAPDSDQIDMRQDDIDKYSVSFRIASQTGNTEAGAIASFDPERGNFNLVGVNTTNGEVEGFVTLSATDMADHILNTIGDEAGNPNNAALRSMIDQGPPPMFKADHFIQGEGGRVELSQDLTTALFSDGGFFAQGSRRTENGQGNMLGSDAGEEMTAGLLKHRIKDFSGYNASAHGITRLMKTPGIQRGLQIDPKIAEKTEQSLDAKGAFGKSKFGEGVQKLFFKPLGTALPQFLKLAEVTRQYEDEYNQKVIEYQAAKREAAQAWAKLTEIEGQLHAGSNA